MAKESIFIHRSAPDAATFPQYNDELDHSKIAEPRCVCEFCNGPVDRSGETTAHDNAREINEVVNHIAIAMWERPQTLFVTLAKVVLHKRGTEIAQRFNKLTGRKCTRQNVNHHLVKSAQAWKSIRVCLFTNKHRTDDKRAK